MKIAIGADSYGYAAKQAIIQKLEAAGHVVTDAGIHSAEPDANILDYADAVASAVSSGAAESGILLCMSGGAMCIRANRWPGVRAVLGFNAECLAHDRQASNANLLCLPASYVSQNTLESLVEIFQTTPFDPLERRVKRLEALDRPCTLPAEESLAS